MYYFTFLSVFHTSIIRCFFFYWSMSDRKCPQISRTLLSILTDLNKAVVGWFPLVHLFPNLLVPLPILWELFQVHQLQFVSPSPSCSIVLFRSLAMTRYLSLFSLTFNFTLWSAGTEKSAIRQVLVFSFHCSSQWFRYCLSCGRRECSFFYSRMDSLFAI